MITLFRTTLFVSLMILNSAQQKCPTPLKDCSRDKISFFLYTAAHEQPQELILTDPACLKNIHINENSDFKFIVHGYDESKDAPIVAKLREEYFKTKAWNIIYVDYKPLAIGTQGCYFDTSVPSVPQIGKCAASLLTVLFHERPEITIDKFHFIGFSMGAQICAQISKNLHSMKIPRITGCDPASPGFDETSQDPSNILNKQHANFVDAIHTQTGFAGVPFSNAHYDIYAADGSSQPGCNNDIVCSHDRAVQIFAESINSSVKFIAAKCDSYNIWNTEKVCSGDHKLQIQVGEPCSPPKNAGEIGVYQFNTHDKPPFALSVPSFRTKKV